MGEPLDPDVVAADERASAALCQTAALAGAFYAALHDQKLPECLCIDLVRDWHSEVISAVEVADE